MKKYKVIIRKTGIGTKASLYFKAFGIWWLDTTSHVKRNYEYKLDETISYWVAEFKAEVFTK